MSELEVIASGLGFPEGPVVLEDGSVLVVEIARGQITKIDPAGVKSVLATPGGGPNGLAVGPDAALYLCNSGGFVWHEADGVLKTLPGTPSDYTCGRIERVDPKTGTYSLLYDRCDGRQLRGPNDIVFDRHGGFYFTDFGKSRSFDRDVGAVYYATAAGGRIEQIVFPISLPNGIGLSPDHSILYVAETETSRLWAFDIVEPGTLSKLDFPSPHGGRLVCGLPGYQRFDSLAVDAEGNICVATLVHGCISVIAPDGRLIEQIEMPEPFPTNICFGGKDLRTAFITLSSTGKVVRMPWKTPGLPLSYGNHIAV